MQTATSNRSVYEDPAVASHYAALDYVAPCEQRLFRAYSCWIPLTAA